jgi:hypothetical protein
LSVTIDPVGKTVKVGDLSPLPIQGDAIDNTITFGSAASPTFGILNRTTGALWISSFEPSIHIAASASRLSKRATRGEQTRPARLPAGHAAQKSGSR